MRRALARASTGLAAAALAASAGAWADSANDEATAAARKPPVVHQMIAYKGGKTRVKDVRARAVDVEVGDRRCAVAAGTPLAALVRTKPKKLRLEDFGSCSDRAADAGGLYVVGIGPDREEGTGGWVYKVGRKAATAGAADPAGPFGSGRLKKGAKVLWFYCLEAGNCQSTLSARAKLLGDGSVHVRVSAYDDLGKGTAAGGATVRVGKTLATTDADGVARLHVPSGRHRVFARSQGLVPSFPVEVGVP